MNNIQEANKALCRAVGDLALAIVYMGDVAKEEVEPVQPWHQVGDKSVIEHVPGGYKQNDIKTHTNCTVEQLEAIGDEVLLAYNENGYTTPLNVQLVKVDPNKPIDEAEPLDIAAKQPEVAQVGDTVKRQDGAVFVVRLRSDGVWGGVVGFDVNGTGVEHSARDGEYTIIQCATDKREGEAPEPSTAELVDMLAKREGISETSVDPHHAYSISVGAGEFGGTGPARILVVTD